MNPALTATVGFAVFLAVGFGWRSWWHSRHYGGSGFALFRSGRFDQNVRDALLLVVGVVLMAQAMAAAMSPGLGGMRALGAVRHLFGAMLLIAATALMVVAQLDLGASWRIGVVKGERPGLVTSGIYAWSRNPIYVAVFLMLAGYTLLLPTWLSWAIFAGSVAGFRRQAVAEEEHLAELYGEEYRQYAARVGRFIPRIGRRTEHGVTRSGLRGSGASDDALRPVVGRFAKTIQLVVAAGDRGGFRVALIGGFALPFLGVIRATADVDFLVEGSGSAELDRALIAAGMRCLSRTDDAASYESTDAGFSSVDVLYARRPAAMAMLDRAKATDVPGSELPVPVADAEAIIGLKVQAIANDPSRRDRDRDDIRQLLARHASTLDVTLLRSYFRLFEMEAELDELLHETRQK